MGGKGSGHRGHKGRKGKRGGSAPRGAGGGSWNAIMAPGEAKTWNEGTIFEDKIFHHFAEPKNIQGIKKEGFRPGEGFYGTGIYLTTEKEYAPMRTRLSIAVKVTNPVHGRREMDKLYKKFDPEFTMEPLELLGKAGKDAYVLPRTDGSTWVMVPNREQVVVVEE